MPDAPNMRACAMAIVGERWSRVEDTGLGEVGSVCSGQREWT